MRKKEDLSDESCSREVVNYFAGVWEKKLTKEGFYDEALGISSSQSVSGKIFILVN